MASSDIDVRPPESDRAGPGGGEVPVGVDFHWGTIYNGFHADNQCMTWAADGNLYCTADDGRMVDYQGRNDAEWKSRWHWRTNLVQIRSGPEFSDRDIRLSPGFPENYGAGHPLSREGLDRHYGYGALSVDGRIYSWLWLSRQRGYCIPIAKRLIYTDDFGQSFHLWDGRPYDSRAIHIDQTPDTHFFYKEDPTPKEGETAYAFNWLEFLQMGQDYRDAKDEYVYLYGPEQKDCRDLTLLRVPKTGITDRSAYRCFTGRTSDGSGTWSSDLSERKPVLRFPEKDDNGKDWNVYSWYPSIVYNKGLGCYLMISYGHTDRDKGYWYGWCQYCERSASVGMWWSKHPWGPWRQFFWKPDFKMGHLMHGQDSYIPDPNSRTLQWKFNPKWISDDGRTMWVQYNDSGNHHLVPEERLKYYRYNHIKVTIKLERVAK